MSDEQRSKFLLRSSKKEFQDAIQRLYERGKERQIEADFVFAGSRFAKMSNGMELYQANLGSLICVANFADAMIDINQESTASNDSGLLFEPWTSRIPPVETVVYVEMIPQIPKPASPDDKP